MSCLKMFLSVIAAPTFSSVTFPMKCQVLGGRHFHGGGFDLNLSVYFKIYFFFILMNFNHLKRIVFSSPTWGGRIRRPHDNVMHSLNME